MSEMDMQRKQVQEKQISNEAEIEENKNILNQEKDSHYQKSLSPNDVEYLDYIPKNPNWRPKKDSDDSEEDDDDDDATNTEQGQSLEQTNPFLGGRQGQHP